MKMLEVVDVDGDTWFVNMAAVAIVVMMPNENAAEPNQVRVRFTYVAPGAGGDDIIVTKDEALKVRNELARPRVPVTAEEMIAWLHEGHR